MAIPDRNSMSGPATSSHVGVLGPPTTVVLQNGDESQYGPHATEMLRKAARDVALSSSIETKLEAFREGASTLSKAAADQWLPKNVVVDRLVQGAVAGLVGIECGVVSGVINLESSGVEASDWRPRHDEHYHEA